MKFAATSAALLAAFTGTAWAAGTSCEDLAKLKIPHTEITDSRAFAKGAYPAPPARGGRGAGSIDDATNFTCAAR